MEPNQRELKCIEYVRNILEPDPFLQSLKMEDPEDKLGNLTSVSPIKTFSQLWKDRGLDKHGIAFFFKKQQCMQEWVEILYSSDLDLEEMVQKELKEQTEYRAELSKSGIRLNLTPPVDLLPGKIDEIFGAYA